MTNFSRKTLFKSFLLLSMMLSTFTFAFASAEAEKTLTLKIGAYKFKRVAALFDGRVRIKGCDITVVKMGVGDMNTNVFHGLQDLDVTEIGLHPFMLAYANDDFRDYTLLPIFPMRFFRHKSIFISTDSGIKSPKDLKGKTVATSG